MKTLGVIGGAGPMATAYFMQQVIGMTKADIDQEHIRILVDNNPMLPDRTKYILDNTQENPEPVFLEMGKRLIEGGADILAIPCITASYFIPRLSEQLEVPIVDTIGKVTEFLLEKGINSVGLMATDGTIKTALFQNRLEQAGIHVVLPDEADQAVVMDMIYGRVKAGLPVDVLALQKVRDHLKERGAIVSILGCTELSVAAMDNFEQLNLQHGFLDAMMILAAGSILGCGASLKEEL